ncbi:hypothetical protein ACCAA_430051 [Candidatus Accumulibacter aalborgensis]|uniref:Uncharacterized protein n=1 Tax=Candidatus Accumulibacter aalborgensis TaxID=1860102 RepID=A0A1A8XU54_9PROT|nr:hypothetical protein [Candidatus Accumulibacter aalborgensis]SBT07463.1 hypothetical protein ACCAA_430051 [Candidatus Accumulibacter aalborgensis]
MKADTVRIFWTLHQMLAGQIGGKQGLGSTLIVLLAVALIVTPTIMLGSQFGDSVHELINLETSIDDTRVPRHTRCAGCSGRTEAHPLGELNKSRAC